MKKISFIALFSLFFALLGCGDHSFDDISNILNDYLSSSSSGNDLSLGLVPNTVIPDDIKTEFKGKMPIYSGITPPDISGKYVSSRNIIIGSSLDADSDKILTGGNYYDLYMAFTKKGDKIYYRSKQGDEAYGNSDDLTVDVVGEGDNFTAYFIEVGEANGIKTKMSVVISGTMTSSGIKDYYYSFIMLEKGPDPDHKLVSVKTYRIFKDSDGLAERADWSY
ncbi:MAG: hypothetical protein LBC75_12675 [Fibromonadaceae bacterium]|jgi:hypothetical protein|nr:hypothetical protein [Fibromonadaceae bacterium]